MDSLPPDPDAAIDLPLTEIDLPAAPPPRAQEILPRSMRVLREVRVGMQVDEFFLSEEIGLGGNGVVYRALDQSRACEVAIKFIALPTGQSEAEAVARFQDTVALLRRLKHQAIVDIMDIRPYKDLQYVVMDLFLGPFNAPMSLRDYGKLCGGMIDPPIMRKIFLHVLDAMNHMHSHGVFHCDLKPANVLFKFKGRVQSGRDTMWRVALKLTDFGLVQLLGEETMREGVRQAMSQRESSVSIGADTSSLLLTFDYMSPEQRKGAPPSVQSDIYSMGLMLYHFLAGANGLALQPPSKLRPKTIKPAWDPIIETATNKDPDQRYQSAAEMAKALAAIDP